MHTGSVGQQDTVKVFIPVILFVIDDFDEGTGERLVCTLIQAITLRVVGRANAMLNASQLKKSAVQFIHKFPALIRVAVLKTAQPTY